MSKSENLKLASITGATLALLSPLPQAMCKGQLSEAAAIGVTVAVSAAVAIAVLAATHVRQNAKQDISGAMSAA